MNEYILPNDHGEHKSINYIEEEIKKVNNFFLVSEVFKQLSDLTRLRIFWVLCYME